jgi:hypothetical protein
MQRDDRNSIARRTFLGNSLLGLGGLALASLLNGNVFAADPRRASTGALPALHFAPRARRVIFLFMSGGPSHLELFDPKPKLKELQGQDIPASVRGTQRLSANTANQADLPLVGSPFGFQRCGRAGVEISELLPHTASIVDDIALVRSLSTDSINHDPAITMLLTGGLQPGRPTMGSWLSYGLGSLNKSLPEYVVLLSGSGGQPLRARFWGNGFLPGSHQGVEFRAGGDPVLYVNSPEGVSSTVRREVLDGLRQLNALQGKATGDPEIAARINAYEMAYRMQTSVPELMDIAREPLPIRAMYGAEPGRASFANNCLLARRLAERGVRFLQLCHRDWDHHADLPAGVKEHCRRTDRPPWHFHPRGEVGVVIPVPVAEL